MYKCLILLSFFLFTSCQIYKEDVAKRPNILLIFTDDQGMNDLSCFGSEIATPNIDSIAKDGVRFTSWYAGSSICTPSRFSLLTGKYPSRSKDRLLGPLMFLEEKDKKRGIKKSETTIASVLGESGYDTALIGKWHLGHGGKEALPGSHGFQKFIGHTGGCIDYFTMRYGIQQDWYKDFEHNDTVGYATDVITDEAVSYISENRKNPFFLYLSYNAPHFGKGWDVGRQQVINFMQAKDTDLKDFQHIKDPIRRQFAAMVKSLDDGVGKVLESLEDNGLRENTLVIFMSDNGGDYKYGGSNKPYRGQKATLYEGGIRVPCVLSFPQMVKPGQVSASFTGALDLFPTFCELAGVDYSKYNCDGQSLVDKLKSGKDLVEREMLFELHGSSALRVGEWKLLDDKQGKLQLFNLKTDPSEENDLSQERAGILDTLKHRQEELLKETKTSH
ncbi:MAG: sulfatase-like hydrolase/transferase [Lentisphaeraceae bacterium]|nr:sulfatase-like hydrolase/transferase [Lentisphaeraceae bacterium]